MSHFDLIIDGLATLGFLTLCALFCFFALMAIETLNSRREQARKQKKTLEALKAKWQGVALEQH